MTAGSHPGEPLARPTATALVPGRLVGLKQRNRQWTERPLTTDRETRPLAPVAEAWFRGGQSRIGGPS